MNKRYIIPLSFVVTLFLLLKVYIANELYYTSRNIQKLSIQINALKEERNILKLQIEKLQYKNTIIDPLFNYQPKNDSENNQTIQIKTDNKSQQKKPTQLKNTKELFEKITIPDEEGN